MKNRYSYEYPRPMVTVDTIIFKHNIKKILLIKRKNPPYQNRWALPGGFINMDEELKTAAMRELEEETGITIRAENLIQLGAYGKPGRDPRGRTISVVFIGNIDNETNADQRPKGGDDAALAQFFKITDLPVLAFDHAEIIKDALEKATQNIKKIKQLI
jgi:8-oxo-dGTP diphosphatase